MPLPIGILDQSPILTGASARDAVFATIELAKAAERLGYHRYWLAEHHATRGLADAAPEILVARIAAETAHIRVGTGGVLLPHYSALKVAEQFRMLEALTPGRIDLGIGRAPGGSRHVACALDSREIRRFPEQVHDVVDFLNGTLPRDHPFASLVAMPSGETVPEVWLLGSSDYSGALAAEMGLPFAFAHFISGDATQIARAYRRHFQPSMCGVQPRMILAAAAIVAETPEEAEELAGAVDLWRLRISRGIDLPLPTRDEVNSYPFTPFDRAEIEFNRHRLIVGTPHNIRMQIESVARAHSADEIMIVTITPDYQSRLRSYELLAQTFALRQAADDDESLTTTPRT
ncbi:MAG: LLM class flavin-dependent oxidoreductase [Vulcanimicrobiaceae bacterium]